jgi:hypothetical protein
MKKRQPEAALFQASASPAELDLWRLARRASPALLVIGIWMARHPFAGIVHDSRLYVAQALHALQPDIFGQDLFFKFGSQDEFTLFSTLFAPLVAWLEPSAAAMIVVAAGHALWLSGAAALALRLASAKTSDKTSGRAAAVGGLVLVAAMPAFYGGLHTLSFGEGFATPRLPAEGLALWALWALTQNRLAMAAAIAAAIALLHPLVAATALGAGFLVLAFRDRRWAVAGLAGLAAVAVMAFAGVAPFDRLAQTMDPEWLAVVAERNTYLFPASWQARDWCAIVFAAAATLASAAILSGWRRHLMLAATLTGLGGLLVTHLGADIWRNLFLIQVQPYRALWLMQVFACLGTGLLIVRLWRMPPDGPSLAALIGLAWMTGLALHPVVGVSVGCVAYAIAALRLRGAMPPFPAAVQTASNVAAGLLLAFLAVGRLYVLVQRMAANPGDAVLLDVASIFGIVEIATAAVLALGIARIFPRAARTVLPLAALMLVVVAAAGWDRRDAWSQTLAQTNAATSLDSQLADTAQVYWESDVRGAWLLLRRPSYISYTQGAGLAFNRRTALAFRDRARALQPVTPGELIVAFRSGPVTPLTPLTLPPLTRGDVAAACRNASGLDAMVLPRAVPAAYAAEWELPTPIYDAEAARKGVILPPIRRLYLYRCADLR